MVVLKICVSTDMNCKSIQLVNPARFTSARGKNIEILFLEAEYAGAEEAIMADLITYINSLDTSEDVIWSRLFGIITPYAKAQVNILEIGDDGVSYGTTNIIVGSDEYAATVEGNINITVVN